MRLARLGGLACLFAAVSLLTGVAAAETVTLGETGADTACNVEANFIVAQTGVSSGPSYTVPSGQWTITSWSAAGGSGGQEALVVFRPTGTPHQYTIVGSTAAQTLSAPLNMFTTSIKVEGGDLIGFWVQDGTMCARETGSPGDTGDAFFPSGVPAAATTLTLAPLVEGFRLNMSVTLTRDSSGSGRSKPKPKPAPVVTPELARIAICTAKPIPRTDGTVGTFADVLASQYPTTDPSSPYFGAVPAKYAQGLGLTCDDLPGYSDSGYKVNGDGIPAPAGLEASWPAPYEYYTKNV
jgi:hypothetical protein